MQEGARLLPLAFQRRERAPVEVGDLLERQAGEHAPLDQARQARVELLEGLERRVDLEQVLQRRRAQLGLVERTGLLRVGPRLGAELKANWPIALAGAALSTAAYGIAIWAMTVAPIALVAALRETSVLFATLFSTLLLREPWVAARTAATLLVLAGALMLRS